ncbi:hypothetical protein [Cupriavidus pinatubonensis]|uniref:hypothetical protein n=1 Tax=Cupriavidus pinatubonensis TaxID=248026 RepID=UPI002159FD92|nr:hypothetical protein [Cupriavidus pinatubonensis]
MADQTRHRGCAIPRRRRHGPGGPLDPAHAATGAGPAGRDRHGIVFPKGTPAPIVARFNAALNKVLGDKAVANDLESKGVTARPGTPAALQAAVQKDIPYWGAIAKSVGATGE